MNTTCRVERLDILCLEKLWSSVCHRLRRSVSEVGAVFILDVDVKRYLRVGTLLHFIWVSIIEMRTSCFFCVFLRYWRKTAVKTIISQNFSELANSGEIPDYHVLHCSKDVKFSEWTLRTWLSSLRDLPMLHSNEHYLMTHIQKGRHGK